MFVLSFVARRAHGASVVLRALPVEIASAAVRRKARAPRAPNCTRRAERVRA